MAFAGNSRYRAVPTVAARDASGRPVEAVKLRRIPPTDGASMTVDEKDRLDLLAGARFGEPTLFWHIADANSALEAGRLTALEPGADRTIRIPEP